MSVLLHADTRVIVQGFTGDKATYEKDVKGFVDTAFADMPRIPLFQPYVNTDAMGEFRGARIEATAADWVRTCVRKSSTTAPPGTVTPITAAAKRIRSGGARRSTSTSPPRTISSSPTSTTSTATTRASTASPPATTRKRA